MLFVLLLSVFVICVANGPSTVSPSNPPPHRGAARQMYGSASLRQPGSRPAITSFQQPIYKQPTSSPSPLMNGKNPQILFPPYAHVPPPFPIYDPHSGYPYLMHEIPPHVIHPSHRNAGGQRRFNGKYGGRPEYYGGPPTRGLGRGRYPIDFGFIPGAGFTDRIPNIGIGKPISYKGTTYGVRKVMDPEHDAHDHPMEHPCVPCDDGQFQCPSNCDCIPLVERCDGQVDCLDQEDEIGCTEYLEHVRNVKCEENKNQILCPKTGRCIKKEWLCDGDDDCGDFSDETRCGFSANCTNDQFECNNGLCIPKTWLCDEDNDCKDYSDEHNCTKLGCSSDEFTCADGTCISLSWKCDNDPDCNDKSDESECESRMETCGEDEFYCAINKCIKSQFKCDGDNDCDDWSDEENCQKIPGSCDSGEFKCNNGKCIPERWRCDIQQDCDENEDEMHCDSTVTRSCSPDEFTCKNGACILHTWVCDGVADCNTNEDESDCEIVCDESKFPCTAPNDTRTLYCINKKHVCDSQLDCPNGEDEKDCPIKKTCPKSTNCTQLCIEINGKEACSCHAGYNLAKDKVTCEDIDECMYETDPVCSQTCNNTIGSFKCGCMTGYVLRPDLRSCKAMGAPPTLLFANRVDIRQVNLQVSLSNSKYTAILKGLHNAIALDYHYEKGLIYWSDVSMDVIRRAYVNGSGMIDVIKWGLESPAGIALDWVHDLLFWTDSGTRRVEVSSLDGKERAIVAANDLDKPRAIAVHPGEALVFWTDWGPKPKIERAHMDGSSRRSIITESIFWPNGLTLDYTASRVYWADAKHNVIETSLFDGTERKKVISKGLPHPFALTIFEDAIYWTDWHTKAISGANKLTGAGLRTIHSNLHFPMDIHSYHPQRQPTYKNHCGDNNGGCTHLCLPNKKAYTCVCRMGQKLKPDGKTCQGPEKMLIFARKKDLRIKYLDNNALHQHEMIIPVDGVKSAVALDWESKSDTVFWTDVARNTINKAYWNGSNQEILVQSNIISPAGLALDWVTDKLYWTDSGTSRIEVAKTDGNLRTLLIWDGLDKPRDIVVDPIGGYMYWSDWGDNPQIERAAMDGTMRTVLISHNLTWPNGLAIDHASGKLYWTDGGTKAIEYSNLDGTNRRTLLEGPSLVHPFGLDVFGNSIFWTDWDTGKIESANKITGLNRTIVSTGLSGLMDVRVFHRNRNKNLKTPCTNGHNGGCSHLCLLKPKGYSCACPIGIKLGDDKKTCANGPTNSLIVAHRIDIRQISLDVPYIVDVVLPFPRLKCAVSVDVDRKTGEIYWTDNEEDVIQKSSPDGQNIQTVMSHELQTVDGIAIDSAGRKIYWTDGDRNCIEVAELDGKKRKVLFWQDLDSPRAITLHYHHGLMFWSDWGKKAKIEVAHMDGTNRQAIITENVKWPNGLAIDRPAGRIYWNDGQLKTIESSDLTGKNRKVIVTDVPHPYGLVVVGNHMYWTDWQTQSLHRADKLNGTDRTIIITGLEGLMDVRSVQADNFTINACQDNNGGCSHLCLRNPVTYTCACPTGMELLKDNKICDYQPSSYLLLATRTTLVRVSLATPEMFDVTLPIQNISRVLDVDFHWKKQLIYYTDIDKDKIISVNMANLDEVKEVVNSNISGPNGIAVDWVADNIYYTDTGSRALCVVKLDEGYRKVIINTNLTEPRSLAVFPRKGYLFWTDWGEKPKIERSFLDGSSRRIIVNMEIGFPNGLVIDYKMKLLYWADARWDKVERSDLNGRNRYLLLKGSTSNKEVTYPFSVAQFGNDIYWSDWHQQAILKADKVHGENAAVIRSNLEGAMGIVAVSESRQAGWNPCGTNNGGCTHFCFFKQTNYTCECPDEETSKPCKKEPDAWQPLHRPGDDYDEDDLEEEHDDYEPNTDPFDIFPPGHSDTSLSTHVFLFTLIPMVVIFLLSVVLVIVTVLYKKNKKKYLYATGRNVMTFSNPNYYTPGIEPAPCASGHTEKRPFLWRRLKYDKSQERVYEVKGESASPEVVSLIPTVLTPSGSNCEAITPEIERSPSVTPLHRIDSIQPVV